MKRELVCGGASAALFLFLLYLGMTWGLSLGLAFAAYFGFRFLLPPKQRRVQVQLPEGVDQQTFDAFMLHCQENLALMRRTSERIHAPIFRDTTLQLCHIIKDIVENFEKDPTDIRAAKAFPDRLVRLNEMLETYLELSGQRSQSTQTRRALDTTEAVVGRAVEKFELLLLRLQENEAIDLSTNAKTLDSLLSLD